MSGRKALLIAVGVTVWDVVTRAPELGSLPSVCAATRPEALENFGNVNGVMSVNVPLLIASQTG